MAAGEWAALLREMAAMAIFDGGGREGREGGGCACWGSATQCQSNLRAFLSQGGESNAHGMSFGVSG